VVVEDTAQAGQARGMFFGSSKLRSFLRNSGLHYAILSTAVEGPDGTVPASVKKYLDAVAGKALPQLFQTDDSGVILAQVNCPLDPDAFVALFAPKPPHARAMGCRDAAPKLSWTVFGTTPGTKLIPRSEWKEMDLEGYLPPVHDQDGRGQCNASATCTAIEASRELAGLSYTYLSAGDLYSQINGGVDQGSTLEDGLAAATGSGVASVASVPYVWDGRKHNTSAIVAERRRYRVVEAFLCPTFDHMASAVQQGFVLIEGLLWYDNFTPDIDGWLPPRGRGNYGGHALTGYGLAQRNGVYGIKTRNSWGVTWGHGGNCVIPESLFGRNISGWWAIRSVVRTPEPFPASDPIRRLRLRLDLP